MTTLPYFIQLHGCEPRYMPRDSAISKIRGLAFAGCRSASIGNVVERIFGNLSNERFFLQLRSEIRKNGITPQERFFACEELCHQFRAILWDVAEWKIDIFTEDVPQLRVNGDVFVFPSISDGTGRQIRTTWNVEWMESPLESREHKTAQSAIKDIAARVEDRRISEICSRSSLREHPLMS